MSIESLGFVMESPKSWSRSDGAEVEAERIGPMNYEAVARVPSRSGRTVRATARAAGARSAAETAVDIALQRTGDQ